MIMRYLLKKHRYSLKWTIIITIIFTASINLFVLEKLVIIVFVLFNYPFLPFFMLILLITGKALGVDYISDITMSKFIGWFPYFNGSDADIILSCIVSSYMLLFWIIFSWIILFRDIKMRVFIISLLLHICYGLGMLLPLSFYIDYICQKQVGIEVINSLPTILTPMIIVMYPTLWFFHVRRVERGSR